MKSLFALVLYIEIKVKTKKFKFHNSTFKILNKSTLSIDFFWILFSVENKIL